MLSCQFHFVDLRFVTTYDARTKEEGAVSRNDFKIVKNLPVSNILLDPRNARIRAGHDQADCVHRILRKEDQIIALAADIAENGLTTMPILVAPTTERGTYVVRDGNRRVTALKLLNDPERWSPDARLKARFMAIRERFPSGILAEVDVLSSSNEDAMTREVLARHSGAMGGVGQLDWSAFLRTVYLVTHQLPVEYKRPGQYAFWAEDHDIELADEFPITSLQRFFSKENLSRLGFEINAQDELVPNIRVDMVKKMAATILGDFGSSRVKVADVFVPADAAAYISRVRQMHGLEEPPPPATPAPAPSGPPGHSPAPGPGAFPPADGGAPPPPAAPAPAARAPTPRQRPVDRSRIFGRSAPGIAVPDSERKAATIVTELRKMDLDETPFAASMLLRALIEIGDEYYRKGPGFNEGKLAKNVRKSARHMRDRGMLTPEECDITVRLTTGDDSLIQIETLQKMMHRDTHHLDKQFINTFWDNVAPFVRACWR